jgi:hypothetical protein
MLNNTYAYIYIYIYIYIQMALEGTRIRRAYCVMRFSRGTCFSSENTFMLSILHRDTHVRGPRTRAAVDRLTTVCQEARRILRDF